MLGITLLLGAGNMPSQVNAGRNYINNVLNPFLYPQSQPKDLEKNYKSCPPTKQDTPECQVYIVCGDHDKNCLNKARTAQ